MRLLFLAALIFAAACSAAAVPAASPPVTTDSVATTDSVPVPLPPIKYVAFSPFVLNNWSWLYAMWSEREWAGCLYGYQKADTLHVEHLELGAIIMATRTTVLSRCRVTPDIIGSAHSHPEGPRECDFSPVDLMSIWPESAINVVVCAPDKFVFRIKGNDVLQSMDLERALPPDTTGIRDDR